jgi:hypothetical protein
MQIENRECLPDILYNALRMDWAPVEGEIHVTQLIGPAMIDHLRREHWDDLVDDASSRLFALLGQGLHAAIANDGRISYAKAVLSDILKRFKKIDLDTLMCVIQDLLSFLEEKGQTGIESSLRVPLDGGKWTLVGTDDRYDEVAAKIMDWKTTSVWSVLFAEHTWEEQLNVYGWMRRKLGYEVKELEVWALLRDWQKSKAKYGGDPKYPKIPFVRVKLPVWSMKKAEEYVYGRLIEFTGDPKPCTPEERWQQPTVYKVMKKGRKTALMATRWKDGEKQDLLSVADAMEAARDKGHEVDGTKIYIQEFKGKCNRCEDYCVVNQFCEQYMGECDHE